MHENAREFVRAALAAGHEVRHVFFYQDAVLAGSRHVAAGADDSQDPGQRGAWRELAEAGDFELLVCVSAAGRRGVVDETLDKPFAIVGLGMMVEAMEGCDRMVSF